jgi:hypothetical protein
MLHAEACPVSFRTLTNRAHPKAEHVAAVSVQRKAGSCPASISIRHSAGTGALAHAVNPSAVRVVPPIRPGSPRRRAWPLVLVYGLGPAMTLFRGDSGYNRRRRTYGLSWSSDRVVAESFATGLYQTFDAGSVLLEVNAPTEAIICAPGPHDNRYGESEFLVDRRCLTGVRVYNAIRSANCELDLAARFQVALRPRSRRPRLRSSGPAHRGGVRPFRSSPSWRRRGAAHRCEHC